MKWILIFLCFPAFGQLPVLPFAPRPISSVVTPATFMPGLAEYWEFTSTSLTTNATVTNWIGALQGTILTNGASSLRPTNSLSGVGFNGTTVLTNVPFPVGTNWTAAIFYQFTGTSLSSFPASLFGSNNVVNNTTFVMGLQSGGTGKQNPYYCRSDGTEVASDGNAIFITTNSDLTVTVSNNVNGGNGTVIFWTNSVINAMNRTSGGNDPTKEAMGFLGTANGGANGPGKFIGWIQGFYIMTNIVCTDVIASNIHYYRTNYLTPGAQ